MTQQDNVLSKRYTREKILELRSFLRKQGAFRFTHYPSGLFPAVAPSAKAVSSGYKNVWVRDNVFIGYAHFAIGRRKAAKQVALSLAKFFRKYSYRFKAIINGEADPSIPMARPHIRFDGEDLRELKQGWSHAQNDALGYFLWFYCRLIMCDVLHGKEIDANLLALFPKYFEAIGFWKDQDSGHWEEARKVSASSIGVATAGLLELREVIVRGKIRAGSKISRDGLNQLIKRGRRALHHILPTECIQKCPRKNRKYDAALLFLIYPLNILKPEHADAVLANVRTHLEGRHGIRRYLGDSYWAPDYRTTMAAAERSGDFSDYMSARDSLWKPGKEAQWCIFDPILSVIYGKRFQNGGRRTDLNLQAKYFNRALSEITGSGYQGIAKFRCPEAYFVENGRYVPNDNTPLYWTQGNLLLAFECMLESKGGRHSTAAQI